MDPSRRERNPYQYAIGNPILYGDPSGLCYGWLSTYRDQFPTWCRSVDYARDVLYSSETTSGQKAAAFMWIAASGLGQGLGVAAAAVAIIANPTGAAIGAAFGAAIAGTYSSMRYELAKSGACGCEAKAWADQVDGPNNDPNDFIERNVETGILVGMPLGAIGGMGLYGQATVAIVGIALGTQGVISSAQEIANTGITACIALDLAGSVATIAASSFALQDAVTGLMSVAKGVTTPANTTPPPELGRKIEYVFGNATGDVHNINRSQAMEAELLRIGIQDNAEGRAYMTQKFTDTYYDPNNILRVQENGRVVKDSLIVGPSGALRMETVWEGNNQWC